MAGLEIIGPSFAASEKDVASLARLPNLTSVKLQCFSRMTDGPLSAAFEPLRDLRSLALSPYLHDPVTSTVLESLRPLTGLTFLDLCLFQGRTNKGLQLSPTRPLNRDNRMTRAGLAVL
mmetsp:Transcript_5123/g.14311  ORF Transcript_5123/g.14311 Transcript_5123/m.14311 type:complete len:119 (-) Transcript_5123:4021-4377(-)